MNTLANLAPTVRFVDREELGKAMEEHLVQLGIDPSPTITARELQVQMVAEGVRPEENWATRELLCTRYGEAAAE
jgi:EAL domain-containing protein (putative c-di-GMP-specific phosphodiesterase class I)